MIILLYIFIYTNSGGSYTVVFNSLYNVKFSGKYLFGSGKWKFGFNSEMY